MRIVIAPQEFKGSLTASESAVAMAEGGPGTVEAVVAASGGRTVATTVRDPLGRLVAAEWGTVGGDTAVIEMAAAAGLLRLAEDELDPRLASTYGVGELVLAGLGAGCRPLIVGQGGSATNDGGAGMAQALGVRFLDAGGGELPPGGATLAGLDRIDATGLD